MGGKSKIVAWAGKHKWAGKTIKTDLQKEGGRRRKEEDRGVAREGT